MRAAYVLHEIFYNHCYVELNGRNKSQNINWKSQTIYVLIKRLYIVYSALELGGDHGGHDHPLHSWNQA